MSHAASFNKLELNNRDQTHPRARNTAKAQASSHKTFTQFNKPNIAVGSFVKFNKAIDRVGRVTPDR